MLTQPYCERNLSWSKGHYKLKVTVSVVTESGVGRGIERNLNRIQISAPGKAREERVWLSGSSPQCLATQFSLCMHGMFSGPGSYRLFFAHTSL